MKTGTILLAILLAWILWIVGTLHADAARISTAWHLDRFAEASQAEAEARYAERQP